MRGVFPPFLQRDFDEEALDRDASTIAALDADGTILWTNLAWIRFAAENGGAPELISGFVQTRYLAPVAPELAGFYAEAFSAALETGVPFEHEYECSSAHVYRRFRLRVLPVGGAGLLLSHSLVAEHPHGEPAAPPLEARYRTEHGLIVQCAHCRRVRRTDQYTWDWVPEWVERMPSSTGHAICPACVGFYFRRRKKPG